jgi:hypothetical protein
MTNIQRMKNDVATDERRETTDRALSKSRDRNDALTQERRFEADATLKKNRARNDEATANRRNLKDGNKDMVLAISFILIALAIVTFFIFI